MKYNHNMDEKNYTSIYTCNFGPIRRYMESRSCDVEKYVGLLVHIEKYLQVLLANESHQSTIDSCFTVNCNLDGFRVGIGFAIL
jgi:hypothetical protein